MVKNLTKNKKRLSKSEFCNKYNKYLKTDKWRKKRLALAYKNHFMCEMCGKYCGFNFEVHHKTYKRVFNEPLCDLMFLCEDCHNDIEIKKRIDRKKIE